MTQSTDYILKQDGQIVRRTTTEQAMALGAGFAASIVAQQIVVIKHLATLNNQPVHASISQGWMYLTTQLDRLTFFAAFKPHQTGEEMLLLPQFDSGENMTLQWEPPKSMRLVLMASAKPQTNGKFFPASAYLLAIAKDKTQWKLPIPNLFEDCRLCLNEESGWGIVSSAIDTLIQTIQQLETAHWNTHLLSSINLEHTHQLFKWKVDKEGVRTQIPAVETWTKCCQKVAVSVVDKYAVL